MVGGKNRAGIRENVQQSVTGQRGQSGVWVVDVEGNKKKKGKSARDTGNLTNHWGARSVVGGRKKGVANETSVGRC